uniref:uncharacterized protein LOC112434853 n=1 Tax=Maylandia zebra TaxID=106582 RepID=UPI000D31A32E|nr:uncharacterized protein LOC112434853 [Maylandia zebra]
MEAKLRVIIDDQIEKLVLPSGIPPTLEELQSVVKDTFGISNDFSLQYFDPEFQDYFTLHRADQIKDKDTVKVVGITPVMLSLTPVDDSFGGPSGQLSDYDSSYAESVVSNADSAATTSSQDTIILKRQKTTERCEPWPKQFPIPQFAYETEMYLERATEEYKKNGNLLPTSKVKTDILENIEDIKARWPALFEASHLQDEFYRITLVHLEPKFMSMLDEYTPKLLALFHSKGGAMGLKLQAIIAKSPSNPSNDITRNLVIRCLMVYLGESIDQLIKEYSDADEDGVSQDLSEQRMKIYKIKAVGSEEDDIGIVLEGVRVMPALGNFPRACAMLVELTYAVNLAYPKELKYTLEVFQKTFLELDCAKLSPKVNSLKNKLLA